GCRQSDPSPKGEQGNGTSTLPGVESTAQVADNTASNTTGTLSAPNTGNTTLPVNPDQTQPGAPAIGGTEYVIAKGDTFSSIATHFHVTTKAIMEANSGIEAKS